MSETDKAGGNFPMDEPVQTGRQGIWLRQSVTFTVDGQTRTLEIALPLRPGADTAEIETLLDEAEAGMRRLTQRLNTRVAEILDPAAPASLAAPVVGPATAPMIREQQGEHATPAPTTSAPTASPRATTPAHQTPTTAAASATTSPTTPAAPPTQPSQTTHPAASAAPAPSHPAPQSQTAPIAPSAPTATAAQPTPPVRPAAAPAPVSSSTPAASAAELTRPQFLAEVVSLGLTPQQAMERLSVRSLNGLNLREALEALRRQLLRGDAMDDSEETAANNAPPASSTAPARPAANTAGRPAVSTQASAPQRNAPRPTAPPAAAPNYRFDEEDDLPEPDVTFTIEDGFDDDEDDLTDTYAGATTAAQAAADITSTPLAPDDFDDLEALLADMNGVSSAGVAASAGAFAESDDPALLGELDALDALDDEQQYIPDNLPPPAPQPAPAPRSAAKGAAGAGRPASRASAPAAPAQASVPGEPTPAAPAPTGRARAMQLIGQLRGVRGGGVASAQQRMAYHNIILDEIGEPSATGLIRLIWRISPDRLGAEQYDALIRWGKEDDFAEEVPLVLSALRAERERERAAQSGAQNAQGTPEQAPTPATPATPATRSAAAPRAATAASASRAASPRRQPTRQDRAPQPAPDAPDDPGDPDDPEAY